MGQPGGARPLNLIGGDLDPIHILEYELYFFCKEKKDICA